MDHEIDPEVAARFAAVREWLAEDRSPQTALARDVVFRDTALCMAFFATARSQLEAIRGIMPSDIHEMFGVDAMITVMEESMEALKESLDRMIREGK